MANLTVRDMMTENPASVAPESTLANVFELMETHSIRHVPVVRADGELVGLVSQRDLAAATLGPAEVPLSEREQMLEDIPVEEIVVRGVETVDPDTDIVAAASMMLENKLGCLLVTDSSELVGILTEADFVRYVCEHPRA